MYFTTKGIVLESFLVKERDRMVSVLTEDAGKVRSIAPGAEKISARFLGATEPAVESTLTFYENGGNSSIAKITGCVILRTFPGLKNDLERFLVTSKILEIINLLTPERQPSPQKYLLTERTLELLENVKKPQRIYFAFVLRFLKLCGWGLELRSCIKCGASPAAVFNLGERGVMCNKCAGDSTLNGKSFVFLMELAKKSGDELDNISVSPETEKAVADVIESYLLEYIPRPLKSPCF